MKDSLNTEALAILKQVDILSNDIPNLGDSANGLEKMKDIFKNESQGIIIIISLLPPL